jgi:predicted DNA-binding protein (MmcQ/YjbR family)
MNVEEFREYCLSKKGVEESFPFGEETLVFKVMGKLFALTNLNWDRFSVNLKCNPERALELRERHSQIIPGYHMNKKHWNTIEFETGLDHELLLELIDHSYDLVVQKMPKKLREELDQLN